MFYSQTYSLYNEAIVVKDFLSNTGTNSGYSWPQCTNDLVTSGALISLNQHFCALAPGDDPGLAVILKRYKHTH